MKKVNNCRVGRCKMEHRAVLDPRLSKELINLELSNRMPFPIAVIGNACEVCDARENQKWVVGLTDVIKLILGMDILFSEYFASEPHRSVRYRKIEYEAKAGRLEA